MEENKSNDLTYTSDQISKVLTIINSMQITGIDNLKYMTTVVTILERPSNLQKLNNSQDM